MVRLVPKKRWNADKVGNISAFPSELKTKNLDIIEQSTEPQTHAREEEESGEIPEVNTRRMQVTVEHLQKHGFTDGCQRCAFHRRGSHARAKRSRHTPACRERIYQAVREALKDATPEEERRLRGKLKLHDEPKHAEVPADVPADVPATPRMDAPEDDDMEAGEQDIDIKDAPIPDIGDENMDEGVDDEPDAEHEMDHDELDAENFEMTAMMDVLQTLGVDPQEANRFCVKAIHSANMPVDPNFIEVYGTGNIVNMANGVLRNLNVDGLDAFDLRTNKKDGTAWDFCKASDRKEAMDYVRNVKPTWVVGSPPCTAFSALQGLNFSKMPRDKVEKILKEGRRHLHFVLALYKVQLQGGRHFLHEHPAGAASWKDSQVMRMLRHKRVKTVVSDQCQYSLVTPGPDGRPMPAKKPTRWASTSSQMISRLSRRCPGDHEHQHLMGGRAANAAFYPPELINEILRGMRDTADAEHEEKEFSDDMEVATLKAAALHDVPSTSIAAAYREADLEQESAQKTVTFKYLDGRSTRIHLDKHYKDMYKDEYTNEALPRGDTKAAIHDELTYFCEQVFRG